MTKSENAVFLFKQGHIREAFNIFKLFKLGFNNKEKRTIEIASDCLNGRSSFYRQIGIDVENEVRKAKEIIMIKYKIDNE